MYDDFWDYDEMEEHLAVVNDDNNVWYSIFDSFPSIIDNLDLKGDLVDESSI